MNALFSSAKDNWCTPQCVLNWIAPLGPIECDPCPSSESLVKAKHYLSDGLAGEWPTGGLIYCNPPYGRSIPAWVDKVVGEHQRGAEIVLLLPARTDTRWFVNLAWSRPVIALIRGRLRFVGAPASAPFPSALFYFGHRRDLFIRSLSEHATIATINGDTQ